MEKKPYLIITLGYPGSGKTYFSEHLVKKEGYFHLSGDKVRLAMFDKPCYSQQEHEAVYRFVDYLAEQFLKQGVSVMYDANFNFKRSRIKIQKLAKKVGASYRLVWIKTDEKKALKRLEQRAALKNAKRKELYRPIDSTVFHILKDEMELPTTSEPYIEIDGHASFQKQYQQFCEQV